MRLPALAVATFSLMVGGAFADPIDERKDLMKERGPLMRILAPVAQGQQEFDAAAVLDALEQLDANAQASADVDALWPEGSESGDTKSAATIWSDRAGFQEASDQYAMHTAAAVSAAPQDVAAFQAVFAPIAASCGTCHEAYRN